MRSKRFIVLFLLISAAGVLVIGFQRRLIQEAKSVRHENAPGSVIPREPPKEDELVANSRRPSSELLKLRNEVTLLREELAAQPERPLVDTNNAVEEWNYVHGAPRSSSLPGYTTFETIQLSGFATPAAAFQSFQHAMRNQGREPLTPTRMKEIWDVPDDFDNPEARYSIDLGEGIGGEKGYRILDQKFSSNEVILRVEFETEDGSTFRRELAMVSRKGAWRMKPKQVKRVD